MRSLGKRLIEYQDGTREMRTVYSDNKVVGHIMRNQRKVIVAISGEKVGMNAIWRAHNSVLSASHRSYGKTS